MISLDDVMGHGMKLYGNGNKVKQLRRIKRNTKVFHLA
jgi:hypothetical protein